MDRFHFLVTHGTDTMEWGFPYLLYSLKGVPCNVAITGSQVPLSHEPGDADAPANLRTAVTLLGRLLPPVTFMVFNRGTVAFRAGVVKVDKWAPRAFVGEELATMEGGEPERVVPGASLREPDAGWHLFVVRTGGTIESEPDAEGLLVPSGNMVSAYLTGNLESLFHGLTSFDVAPRDSSDMSPDVWKEVVRRIVATCVERGAAARLDDGFNPRVGIVHLNPWKTEQDYHEEFARWDGVVLAGYGGGNVNILEDERRSVLPAIREAVAVGRPVVLGSRVPFGATDDVYANGAVPLRDGAMASGRLGLAHAQVKLAYLLGHRTELEAAAARMGWPLSRLLDACFTAGVPFRSTPSRHRYARLKGYLPVPFDPFVNREFDEALGLLVKALSGGPTRIGSVHLAGRDRLTETIEALRRARAAAVAARERLAAIVLLDDAVGVSSATGEPLDPTRELAGLVTALTGTETIVFPLHRLGVEGVEKAVEALGCAAEGWATFLRRFRFLLVTGGRQRLWEPSSFSEPLTREELLRAMRQFILTRAVPGAGKGLFIGLGHEAYAQALADLAWELGGPRAEALVEEIASLDEAAAASAKDFLVRARERFTSLVVLDDTGKEVARGLAHPLSVVHPNERREKVIAGLVPYALGRSGHEVDPEIAAAYRNAAFREATPFETVIAPGGAQVAMLHEGEVDEVTVLTVNWFLSGLREIVDRVVRAGRGRPPGPTLYVARSLPLAWEITSSTLYEPAGDRGGSGDGGRVLTEVASTCAYYVPEGAARPVHDATVQFHPELLTLERAVGGHELMDLPLRKVSDGIRALGALIWGGA